MPRVWCVPSCKANYNSTLKSQQSYMSVFTFPKDENLRQKWIKSIPRKNWTPSKYSAVCMKHFRDSDIISYESWLSPDGAPILKRNPLLVETAVPAVFPDLPAYLSKSKVF